MLSLNELKTFLNITDNSADDFLLSVIDMSVARINNLCRRPIDYGVRYDVIDGDNQNVLWLKNYPIEQIVTIKYRKETGAFDYDLFNGRPVNDNIYLDKVSGKLILLNRYILPPGNSNIQIKYYSGYMENAPDPVNETPKDLKSVDMMMSAEIFLKSFQNAGDEFSKRLGLESYEHLIKEGTNESRHSFRYKDEDYENILLKYKSLRI